MSKTCLWCGKRRKLNHKLACRDCQEQIDMSSLRNAHTAMVWGTGEEEDRAAEQMWDILDGHPERKRRR